MYYRGRHFCLTQIAMGWTTYSWWNKKFFKIANVAEDMYIMTYLSHFCEMLFLEAVEAVKISLLFASAHCTGIKLKLVTPRFALLIQTSFCSTRCQKGSLIILCELAKNFSVRLVRSYTGSKIKFGNASLRSGTLDLISLHSMSKRQLNTL